MKIVFKLVEVTEDDIRSPFASGEFCLGYGKGKTTKPKVGKLMAFDTLKNAKKFMGNTPETFKYDFELWRCEASEAEENFMELNGVPFSFVTRSNNLGYIRSNTPSQSFLLNAIR